MSDRMPPMPRGRKACLKRAPSPFPGLATCCLMNLPEGRQAGESIRREWDSFPAEEQATHDLNRRPVARRRDLARPDHLRCRHLFPSPACIREACPLVFQRRWESALTFGAPYQPLEAHGRIDGAAVRTAFKSSSVKNTPPPKKTSLPVIRLLVA